MQYRDATEKAHPGLPGEHVSCTEKEIRLTTGEPGGRVKIYLSELRNESVVTK